eukprot:403377385
MALIDISGLKGLDAQQGINGSIHGENGSDAGYASMGGDAGSAYLTLLRVQDSKQSVRVVGTVNGQQGFDMTFNLGSEGYLQIDAKGGNGGHGGNGGRGADGRPGTNGSNANSSRRGTNGGDGGNGGNGGSGSCGADAGKGGFVQITVAEQDMDLLTFLAPILVQGGIGGSQGLNGLGGKGGQGGRGGSSHSWTTTKTTTSRDAKGNTKHSTTTVWHTNPGGFNGKAGKCGFDGQAVLLNGLNGQDGQFQFIVQTSQGSVEYANKYDIQIIDFQHKFFDEDTVIEPGEKGAIFQVNVINQSFMPTPLHTDIEAHIEENQWIKGYSSQNLPRNIKPPYKVTVPLKLEFSIRYPEHAQLQAKPRYIHKAVKREPKQLKIEYPLQIHQFQCLRALQPGSVSKVRIQLYNCSNRVIGGNLRKCQLKLLQGGGEFDTSTLEFEYQGRRQNLDQPFVFDVPIVEPKTILPIELIIFVPKEIGYLLKSLFLVQQNLEDPRGASDDTFPCIHSFSYQIRTGFSYAPTPNQDIVFVINENTTIQEVNFMQQTCQSLNLVSNFYDINMQGNLNLFETQTHSGESYLAKDLENKTLVIINDKFTISNVSQDIIQAQTLVFLKKDDMLRAISQHNVHFIIFSPQLHDYNAWVTKYEFQKSEIEQQSHKNFKHMISREYEEVDQPQNQVIGTYSSVVVEQKTLSFQSKMDQINEIGKDNLSKVRRRFPNNSYVACPLFNYDKDAKTLGKLVIMRTPALLGNFIQFRQFRDIMERPVEFAFSILNTIDIAKRTELFIQLSQEKNKTADISTCLFSALEESIVFTLCREIQIGCASKHSKRFKFDEFTTFVTILKDTMKSDKNLQVQGMEKVLLRIQKFSKRQEKFADVLLFWVAHAKLLRQLNSKLKSLVKLLKTDSEGKKHQKIVKAEQRQEYREAKKLLPGIPKYICTIRLSLIQIDFKTVWDLYGLKDFITEEQLRKYVENEVKAHEQCEKLVSDIKKSVDDLKL